jgi:CHAT domain-containing protein
MANRKGSSVQNRSSKEYGRVSSAQEHLSREQVGWFVESPTDRLGPAPDDEALVSARAHLLTCESCNRLIRVQQDVQARIAALLSQGPAQNEPGCSKTEELRELISGMITTDQATKLLEHVVQCDSCSLVLRETTEDFADPTESELEVISSLRTAQPAFQRDLAEKLSATRETVPSRIIEKLPMEIVFKSRTPRPWYWLSAAAVVLLAAGLVSSFFIFSKRTNPDRLLAKAYSEQRSLELRLPGAAPGPITVQRGPTGSFFAKSASLLEAELLIKQQLQKTPNDPKWLAAKGRSELLEWQYDEAIRSFQRALETNSEAPDVLRDLATAHFQRAEVEHQPSEYGDAIEQLGKALAKSPEDSVSLFNRAIVYERMFLYDDALRDWEAYLKLDPSGPWSAEARGRLEEIKKKQERRNQSQEVPIENPDAALSFLDGRLRRANDAGPGLDSIDEQYLDIASEKWLPGLADDLRHGITVNQSTYGRALVKFSKLWQLRHDDPWLSELLDSASEPGFPDAAKTLADAIASASAGNPSLSLQQADLATRQFGHVRSRAGILWARLESVYALQRSLEDEPCLRNAFRLETELRALPYHWMLGKLLLEQAACAASAAQVEDAERFVRSSEKIATERRFGTLYLRGLSFEIDFAADKGDRDLAWKIARQGLGQFWRGTFPAIRGYALCASIGYLAEDSEQSWAAVAFWSEAIPLIKGTLNRSTEGLARYRLATDEMAVGKNAEANAELLKITEIFSSLPNSPASLNYRAASETSLAAVESTLGDKASAKKHLSEVAANIQNVGQYQTALLYYLTLGDQQALEGDVIAAEKSLRSAVAISQLGITNLKNDRDRLNWDRQTSEAYRSLVRLLISESGHAEQALRIWEWYRSLPFQSERLGHSSPQTTLRQLGTAPPPPSELNMNSLIPSLTDVTFLTYAQLRDELVFWVYDDRGVSFHKVAAPVNEVEKVSKRFVRLCSDPTSDTTLLKAEGQRLYEWIIAPTESFLSPGRVVWIEPDGFLSFIPFQALTDRDGRELLERFSMAYRSTAAGERRGSELRINPNDEALVASSSLLAPTSRELLPLPEAEKEAKAVAARFANHQLIVDDRENPEVVRAALRKVALFHYAGHYLSTLKTGGGSVVDSLLTDHIAGGSTSSFPANSALAKCKLVVLSACASGSAERLGLFDPDGLVHPLLRSGARRVIASRWSVDSTSTALLMDSFYTALLSGQLTVEALQSASRKLSSDPRYSHPYYWAAFAVFARD